MYITATLNPETWDELVQDAVEECRNHSLSAKIPNIKCAVADGRAGIAGVNNLTHLPTCDTAAKIARALHYANDTNAPSREKNAGNFLSWVWPSSSATQLATNEYDPLLRSRTVEYLEPPAIVQAFVAVHPVALVQVVVRGPRDHNATTTPSEVMGQVWDQDVVKEILASLPDGNFGIATSRLECTGVGDLEPHSETKTAPDDDEGLDAALCRELNDRGMDYTALFISGTRQHAASA